MTKSITLDEIKKGIKEHRESLEEYDHYRDTLEGEESEEIADLIENCDWDSEDFNIGFEAGFLAGMESIARACTVNNK